MSDMQYKPKVLIVEDNTRLAANLFEFLSEEKYDLDFAPDGLTALHLVTTNNYDIIVLDVMIPGINGFDLCVRIRNDMDNETPIIFMTAKDTLADKEQGYMRGADDYLVKPFELRELQLRIDAICKRQRKNKSLSLISARSIKYDSSTLMVFVENGRQTELSGIGAKLFESLIRNYPSYVSYADLGEYIWGDSNYDAHTIRTHIYSLRKALTEQIGYPLIKTSHGRGYRLLPPEELADK